MELKKVLERSQEWMIKNRNWIVVILYVFWVILALYALIEVKLYFPDESIPCGFVILAIATALLIVILQKLSPEK